MKPNTGKAAAKTPRPTRRPKPASAPSLLVQAYERIKHNIITLRYRPGEALNEAQISESLRIGRTPVHQALNRLMLEGMVEVIPRKGVIVRGVSLNEVMDIIDVRLITETHCAKLAAMRADKDDLAALAQILDQGKKAADEADIETQMTLDREFHLALSRAGKNSVLADTMRNLHDRSLRFWFISLRDVGHDRAVVAQHRAILDAIKRRAPDDAALAVRDHIEAFRTNVARFL
ncbi:MAG: GntR family transcriptional regulator [Rhodospirillales bacterium]|nr:GntR family transcriptional regulator [Rhodospirillales bacterium]